jgi:hypothetical protein
MARLEDARILDLIKSALAEWNCDGFVVWKPRPAEWLESNVEDETTASVGKLMHEFVESGGAIDRVRERRPEYASRYEFHYDFRFAIAGRKVYIETVLDETRTGPTITVVSMHDE